MNYNKYFLAFVGIIGLPCFLAACDSIVTSNRINLEKPSNLLNEKPQLSVTNVSQSWNIDEQGMAPIVFLAKDYKQNGQGNITVLVTFKNEITAGEEARNLRLASINAQKIQNEFNMHGVKNLDVRVAPVEKEKAGLAVVSYSALVIKQPDACSKQSLEDIDGKVDSADQYKIGCEQSKIMSQMIAQKKDLLGSDKIDAKSSAQLGQTMSDYNSGMTQGAGQINVSTSSISQ